MARKYPPFSTEPVSIAGSTRRGVFVEGDMVQLTDPKGRMHTITLVVGKAFHSHRGAIEHDDLIGLEQGSVVTNTGSAQYLALRPLLDDFVLSMPRGAAVIYPKDSSRILGLAGLGPGMRVAEAGVGSGALTCSLLRAVGDQGSVHSYERRSDFAEVATRNIATWFGGLPPNWRLTIGDLQGCLDDTNLDAVILDMLAPWECLTAVAGALGPGGVIVGYVATATQMSKLVELMRLSGHWTEPRAEESLVRTWHLDGLSVRPDHRMVGHSGFLVAARRLAQGAVLPVRRRRPAPGAYGEDYIDPGAPSAHSLESGIESS